MAIFYSKSAGGFYDDTVHAENQIPSDAVEITVAKWLELLEGQSAGQTIEADATGNPILVTPAGPTVAESQATAFKSIDSAAEVLRSQFITANSGQVATYILKYNEATAYKAAGYTGDVPGLVQSEATVTGSSTQAAADSIIAQYTAWSSLAASIETVRRAAKIAVGAATTTDAVNTAVSTATSGFAQIASAAASSGQSAN